MEKILIVDDEQDITEVLQRKLQKSGYDTQTAANGEEALKLCETEKFDLILMDIAMPVMDGYRTCEKLKEDSKTQDIPILLLTTKDLDPRGIAERYDRLGVSGYISKPSTFEELLAKIKEITSRA